MKFIGKSNFAIDKLFGTLSLSIEMGEALGIAGVEGNGQSELIQAIMNPRLMATQFSGDIYLANQPIKNLSNKMIRQKGVGYLAADRHHEGIAEDATCLENFLLGRHWNYSKNYFIDKKMALADFNKAVDDYDIKIESPEQLIKNLSGGNQQKLVVSRELAIANLQKQSAPFQNQTEETISPLKFLLAAHPTRGVDISAIQTIHQRLHSTRQQGTSILIISSELDELMDLSDRILVIFRKQFIAEFLKKDFDEKKIGLAMGGFQL